MVKKRIIIMLLTMATVLNSLPIFASSVTATYDSSTETLTISGSGEIEDSGYLSSPYYSTYYYNVKKIIVEPGISRIGACAFSKFFKLETVEIAEGVKTIGKLAFYGCTKLSSINLPSTLISIERWAFKGCTSLKTINNESNILITNGSRRNGYVAYYADSETTKTLSEVTDLLISDLNSSNLSDLQKALIVHDRLIVLCEYANQDLYAATKDLNNTLLLTVSEHGTIEAALVRQWAVCQGYAESYKYLLNKLGIYCEVVTSKSLNHAWNLVKIDGETYNVDCTFDDPTLSLKTGDLVIAPDSDLYGYVSHIYFLKSDDFFKSNNHSADDYTITATGSEQFDSKTNIWDKVYSPFVLLDGTIYYMSYINGKHTILDFSGNELYKSSFFDFYPSLVAYDGGLYFQSNREIYRYVPGAKTAVTYYVLDSKGIYQDKNLTDLKIYGFKIEDNKIKLEIGTNYAEAANDNSYMEVPYITRGDFDGNGTLTSSDAISLQSSLIDPDVTTNQPGDVNNDSLWNEKDASYLIKHLSNPEIFKLY